MKAILRPTGSICPHCDATASHYVKIMMDGILGHRNFRREIVRSNEDASGFKSAADNWIRGNDIILYCATDQRRKAFNKQHVSFKDIAIRRHDEFDEDDRRYR